MMTLTDRMNTGEAVHFLREWGGGECLALSFIL